MLTQKPWKLAAPIALNIIILCLPAVSSQWGSFKGNVIAKWLGDGRNMQLIEDFSFTDSFGVSWLAPKGTVVDGASIPKPFWSIIGGPFEGNYRNASVIHDHYCDTWKSHRRSWQSVHKTFYYAMLASGVPEAKAITMYIAVRQFGPKWSLRRNPLSKGGEVIGSGRTSWKTSLGNSQYSETTNDVPKSEVETIRRIGIELAQKGTPPSTEVIDSRIYTAR